MSTVLNKIEEVDIDPSGVFKYILIEIKDYNAIKKVVRGYARCDYHGDIFHELQEELKKIGKGLKSKCLGGGRIKHDNDNKKLNVYGYSQGFGKADHELSVAILQKKFSDYEITWSNEGY